MTEQHVYEGTFILDPEFYNKDPEGVTKPLSQTIEALGGTVRVSRLWDDRKLAYPIKGKTHGIYWLVYFRINTEKTVDLNRQFQLNGNILRFLLLKIDPRLEEIIVEHAMHGPIKKEETAPVEDHDLYDGDDEDDDEDDVDVVDAIEEE